MATISNPELTVTTNRPVDRAAVIVNCDIEFTDVEVNAMNMLGLKYNLTCEVYNKELFDEDLVISYPVQQFPSASGAVESSAHVVFDTHEWMDSMHERLIGKDKLVAKLTLTNQETQEAVKAQTEVIAVDLAA
jgi:hypothetical protein